MKNLTTNLTLAAALTLAMATLGAPLAQAQDAKPANEVSFNAAVVSDYRFRGVSQTRRKPALQGGVDYVNNPSGFYAGAWASTIKWTKDAGGDGDIEIDVYAGKRGEITSAVSYDVGVLGYAYPENGLTPSANTFEVYGKVGFGPAYVKYSHSTTNLFAVTDSKNSGYLDVGATFEIADGYNLSVHGGRQTVKNNSASNYNDYSVGVSKDFGLATVGLAVIGTNVDLYGPNGKNLSKAAAVLTVSKTF